VAAPRIYEGYILIARINSRGYRAIHAAAIGNERSEPPPEKQQREKKRKREGEREREIKGFASRKRIGPARPRRAAPRRAAPCRAPAYDQSRGLFALVRASVY